jgi:chemotaxis protein methyltransferase CheR
MDRVYIDKLYSAKLSDKDFQKLSQFIYSNYGIKMPVVKKVMLQGRLQKRLKELEMTSFEEYVNYLFSHEGQMDEVIHMIDVVSTNKTDFFREPVHFEFLNEIILPEFIKMNPLHQVFNVWSAGCSSGEEPYSIAITLNEFFYSKTTNLKYHIYGSDISARMLHKASRGIFNEDKVANVPMFLKKKYFLKSKDRTHPTVKMVSELRNNIEFSRMNFMDANYAVRGNYHVIFCRNVLIYFDRDVQEQVINKLCKHLIVGGYLFLGHSESIANIKAPLQAIKPTIYKRI